PSEEFFEQFFLQDGVSDRFSVNGRLYHVSCCDMSADILKKLFFWEDISELEDFKSRFTNEMECLALIDIDNYDELMANTPVEEQSAVTAAITKKIADWAQSTNAALQRIRMDRYIMLFAQKDLRDQKEAKFPIIDSVHEIETRADFPTSISVGIGIKTSDFATLQRDAEEALGLAIGRGGDQVALKDEDGIKFFGGALPTVEKRNKGKSRIIAHNLIQLMNSSDRIIIMGHVRPDMDSFGSAVGIYALAAKLKRPVDIVLNNVDEAIEIIYEEALKAGRQTFIKNEEALELITDQSLLIVVDTHIPAITECPELIEKAKKIVVIDHHRRSASGIDNATLTHMEVYASSASELVTEILQYAGSKDDYEKFEMEALLAGIAVDSKNFTSNTGVRTFDAASWLRRAGADISKVQSFFKLSLDFYKKKVNIIASAEIIGGNVAVAYTKEQDDTMQVLCAQAANDLLGMKGVDAAFAAGIGKQQTMLSARSRGHINVQTIMEKLGGGGHQTVAAAQLDCSPEEAINKVVQVLRDSKLVN
ncbi:MAG TPA: DHH family phosphoesterase, partial [Bacillota bacterium]|nr:DHH family phosphoesterase [Bacillota bacterium]